MEKRNVYTEKNVSKPIRATEKIDKSPKKANKQTGNGDLRALKGRK